MEYKIKKLERTCFACPSQWEGELEDGRMIYIRYRWGCLEVSISKNTIKDVSDAVEGRPIYQKYIGGDYDGVMDNEEMLSILKDVIECDIEIIN